MPAGPHSSSPTQPTTVLLVTGAYRPEISSGGLQSEAMAGLLAGPVHFRVLTTSTDRALARREMVGGVEVSRIPVDVKSGGSRQRAFVQLLLELLRLIPQVDLVHIQGFSSKNILVSLVAKVFRRPVALHLQTARHDEPSEVASQGRLAWWAFSTADLYLSVSPGLTARYLEAGLPADRIRTTPNGVDGRRFRPSASDEQTALRTSLGLPIGRPLTLFVGVMSPDKQPHVLFDAWLRLQADNSLASTLVLVGSTSPRQFEADAGLAEDIRRRADESGYGDRVIFVPPTSRIEDYFRAADFYVLPSRREGLPIALLEAMACGLPCVASRLHGATDVMVDDGVNGQLVPPGDVAAFAAALTGLLRDPAAAARMGSAARRTIEASYTMEHIAGTWLSAYQHLLSNR